MFGRSRPYQVMKTLKSLSTIVLLNHVNVSICCMYIMSYQFGCGISFITHLFTVCIENSMDLDQLVLKKPADQDLYCILK